MFLSIVKEIFAFIWYGLTGLVPVAYNNSPKHLNKKSIVIVSSWMSQPLTYFFLKQYLEKQGFVVYFFSVSLWEYIGFGATDIDTFAQRIENFFTKHQLKDATLVGISIGGVISLLFLEHYHGWSYVRKFISISAPFEGSILSYLLFFVPLARKFFPGKSVIPKDLLIHNKQKILTVAGKWDEFVQPQTSKLAGIKHITLDDGGHAYTICQNVKTFSLIAQESI